jgi:hypothetical protein
VASGAEERQDHFEPNGHSGIPEGPLKGLKIVEFLDSNPFTSVGQIATAAKIPRSMAFDHSRGFGYTTRHLK